MKSTQITLIALSLLATQSVLAGTLANVKRFGPTSDLHGSTRAIESGTKAKPLACGTPKFAEACAKSSGIAQFDDGTLAVIADNQKLRIIRPQGSAKPDLEIDIPLSLRNENMVISLNKKGEIQIDQGNMGQGNGSVFFWSQDGQLKRAVSISPNHDNFWNQRYQFSQNSDGSYDLYFDHTKKKNGVIQTWYDLRGTVALNPGEKVTSILAYSDEWVSIKGIQNGKPFERMAQVVSKDKAPPSGTGELPPANAVQ